MGTPIYQGPGQPPADNGGLLGGLGSFLGGASPAYAGVNQSQSAASWLGNATPAYAPAPPPPPSSLANAPCDVCGSDDQDSCPVDPTALAAGQIAIVIPRSGPIDTPM